MRPILLFIPLFLICVMQPVVSQQQGIEIIEVYANVQIGKEAGTVEFTIKSRSLEDFNSQTILEISIPNKYYEITARLENQIVPTRVITQNGWTIVEITPIIKIVQDQTFIITINAIFKPEITTTATDTNLLRYDWGFNYPVGSFSIQMTLPYGSVLATQQGNPNLFPSTATLDTNGTHVTVTWLNLTYAEPNNIQTVIVEYIDYNNTNANNNGSLLFFIGIISGVAFIIAVTIAVMKIKGINPKQIIAKPQTEIQIKTIYKPIILKPQQIRILELIKENEPMQQSTLIDYMGLSKSRVSQYLKELEKQNLIVREKDGKENLVYLKQDVEL